MTNWISRLGALYSGNAREQLEKILLGSTGLIQQANQLGLVDPQNPYGKSGFLDVIA